MHRTVLIATSYIFKVVSVLFKQRHYLIQDPTGVYTGPPSGGRPSPGVGVGVWVTKNDPLKGDTAPRRASTKPLAVVLEPKEGADRSIPTPLRRMT